MPSVIDKALCWGRKHAKSVAAGVISFATWLIGSYHFHVPPGWQGAALIILPAVVVHLIPNRVCDGDSGTHKAQRG